MTTHEHDEADERHRRPRIPRPRHEVPVRFDTLAIRKNGHLIGFYVPIKRDEAKVRQAAESLERTIDRIVDENGDIDDRLGEMFDIYRPRERDEEKVREAWERFGETIDRVLQETGMTEDELADIFDLSKPMPE